LTTVSAIAVVSLVVEYFLGRDRHENDRNSTAFVFINFIRSFVHIFAQQSVHKIVNGQFTELD